MKSLRTNLNFSSISHQTTGIFFSCEGAFKYLFENGEVPSYKGTNHCLGWQARERIKYPNVAQMLPFIIFYEKKKICTLKEALEIFDYFWEQTVGKKPLLLYQILGNKR